MTLNGVTALRGTLADGTEFAAWVSERVIAVRVHDQVAVVHPRWMDSNAVEQLAAACEELTR